MGRVDPARTGPGGLHGIQVGVHGYRVGLVFQDHLDELGGQERQPDDVTEHPQRPAADDLVTAQAGPPGAAQRVIVGPGDEALVLTPSWPNGPSIIQMSHGIVKEIPQPLIGDRYAIDFEALERAVTPRTRLLLYTSPSNPLGWVATEQDQEKLLDFTRRHGLWLMADEVYERLVYSDPPKKTVPSILKK